MRSWTKLMVAVAAAAMLSGCRQDGGESPQPTHPTVFAEAGLTYYWRFRVPLPDEERIVRLYRLDENLYCMTNRNRVVAMDAASGRVKWIRRVAEPDQAVFRPCHGDLLVLSETASGIADILDPRRADRPEPFDAVFFNTLSYVRVINRKTGEVVREAVPFDFAANTGGDTNGLYYFVGSVKGIYYGILLQEAVEVWKLSTRDILSAPLVYHDRRLYVGSTDGSFYCTQVSGRGDELWRQETDGPITAAFHVDQRGCFVPSEDNRLYAFGLISGLPLWEPFICEGPLRDPVQVGERTVFQYARRDRLYAIDVANGRKRWDLEQGRVVLAVVDAEAYVLDAAGNLRVIDEMTGETIRTLPLTGWDVFLRNATAPAIYMASEDGHVACIRPQDSGYLSPAELRAAAAE